MAGIGFGAAVRQRRPMASTPAPVPFSAVDSEGWRATVAAPTDLSLTPFAVSRAGYTASGQATTLSETLYLTKRIRQPYPNQASFTANDVALSDYIYSTDTLVGATNGSTETSPKPVARWAVTDREIVGNELTVEIVAFHRNGIAAVEFRATDGTGTVTATTATPVVSPRSTDKNAVIVYRATLDLTTLADNANITVNAKVFPRIGGAASIGDSADKTLTREFSPRVWRKNTARAAAPPIVYVASGGNDTTGYVGPDDALAATSPCATLTGAINRARTVLGTTAGSLDGLRVRLTAGAFALSANPTANTTNSAVIIERGTGVARADAILEFGAGNFTPATTYLRYRDVSIRRQGAFYLYNSGAGHCVLDDVLLNLNGSTGAISGTGNCTFFFDGVTISGGIAAAFQFSTNQYIALLRGVEGGTALSNEVWPQLAIIGCLIRGGRTNASTTADLSGGVIAFNRWLDAGTSSGGVIVISQSGTPGTVITGYAVVQNVVEHRNSSTQPALQISADSSPADTSHVIVWHNSFAGFNNQGRANLLYDETVGDPRVHKLQSFIGNIHTQVNYKSDVFISDGARIGTWAYGHGVGVRDEWTRYRDAGGGSFAQDYPGLNASIGTGNTGAGNDPLFTSYAGTTTAGAAGAGGGDYTLQAGSPVRGRVASSPLPFDLTGAARSGTAASGAYV
jgi:hypothetical protein